MRKIDHVVEERHLLTHPFYQRWQRGKVTREVLREYARQYYAYESSLPSYLTAALAHVTDGPAREAIEANLADETGRPEPHPELWLRFSESLGLSREEVVSAALTPRTANLVETYASLCARGAEEALGCLYAYEAQFSKVAATKADGLRRFYGVTDPHALEFFEWHSEHDDEHAAALAGVVADSERALESAGLAVEAWWGMLDQFETMS